MCGCYIVAGEDICIGVTSCLQDRHWQTIFLGMNEPYMGSGQFTVAELMSYNLCDNADLVHSVYLSAVAEYDLEQQMSRIKRLWQDKNFKLAKHIPDSMFIKGASDCVNMCKHVYVHAMCMHMCVSVCVLGGVGGMCEILRVCLCVFESEGRGSRENRETRERVCVWGVTCKTVCMYVGG